MTHWLRHWNYDDGIEVDQEIVICTYKGMAIIFYYCKSLAKITQK